MSEKTTLPNFIVIGAQKAATTSIYFQLRKHSDIFLPDKKELEFFSTDYLYNSGITKYTRFFEFCEGKKAIGEVSPGYLHHPEAPVRIHQLLPDVKLIACLRNPIDRAYSAYKMQIAKGSEDLDTPFLEAVKREPKYIYIGRYYTHLRRYLQYFERKQLLILLFDDLLLDPLTFYQNIFTFIEVTVPSFKKEEIVKSNTEGFPRNRLVVRILHHLYDIRNRVQKSPFKFLVNNPLIDKKSRKIRNRISSWNKGKAKFPPLTPEERAQLIPVFEKENLLLSDLIGRDLSHWNQVIGT